MERAQLIIVRHGETEWNLKLIRQGHLDSPLTERGIAQAKALGQRLAQEKFVALYSSDLGRAVQTAEMIAAVTGHGIITDERLRERHLGIFQGLSGDEIRERFPEEHRLHRTVGPSYVIPGGESRGSAADTFRRLYWDTALSWSDPVLRMLRATVGMNRVLFGTDYPYLRRDLAVGCT